MPTTTNGGRGRPPIDRGEFFYDDDTKDFFARMARKTRFNVAPYAVWIEPTGSFVIVDRKERIICRVPIDGAVEILPPDTQIDDFVEERFLHHNHPGDCPEARAITLEIVERYDLADELRRRRALGRDLLRPPERPWQQTFGVRL